MIERITSTHQSELMKRDPRSTAAASRKKLAAGFKTVLDKELQRPENGRKIR